MHAVNAHFIRGGDVKAPIEYRVERHRDGRAFANRQVTAYQDGNVVFSMFAAFQDWGAGLEHSVAIPDVDGPEQLPSLGDHLAGYEDRLPTFVGALNRSRCATRTILPGSSRAPVNASSTIGSGCAPTGSSGTIPGCMPPPLAYSSDTTVLDSVLTTHGLSWGLDRIVAATVNHSIWFHRPFRFDEWALYATESPVAAGSRGLATGRFFTRKGELIATVVQEGVIRHFPARR